MIQRRLSHRRKRHHSRLGRLVARYGDWWLRFTLHGFEHETSAVRKRQINLFWTFAVFSVIVFLAFGADHLLSAYGTPLVGETYLGAGLLIALNLALLRVLRRFNLARTIYFVVLTVTLETLLTTGGILQAGILWFFIFPPIAFFLTSRKTALRLITALYLLTIGLFGLDLLGYLEIPYATLTLRQFALSFLLVSLLIYFQERGRERDEMLLIQSEADLRQSFGQLQDEVAERQRAERRLARRTTQLERATAQLERHNVELSQLAVLVEAAGDAVIGKDIDGIITSWNKGAERIYGYRAREVLGKSIDMLVPPDRPDEVTGIMRRIRAGKRIERFDTVRVTKAGELINVSLTISPIFGPDRAVTGASIIARDVTEQKRVEQLKTDFVSLVSHQLKTPVGQVRGYLENMLDGVTGELTEAQRRYLKEMHAISIENYDLISDLLNVSRLERGVVSVRIATLQLDDLVEAALRDYRDAIERKGLKLVQKRPRRPVKVRADAAKVTESLRNVINNALKFTQTGTIAITQQVSGSRATIEVADTGPGIPPAARKRLFTRHQVLSGGAHAGGGAGIGLYIAKNFMTMQHGDLTVRPRRGGGSVFSFTLLLETGTIKRKASGRSRMRTKTNTNTK